MEIQEVQTDADLDAAAAYVQTHGDLIAQARLASILNDEPPAESLVAALTADQQVDGGWAPLWAPGYSSLDATCYRLTKLEQVGLARAPGAVERALQFLVARQGIGGSWEEDKSVAGLTPPWVQPGQESARLYLTANCAQWLGRFAPYRDAADRAGAYLSQYQAEDGHIPGFLHSQWLAAALWIYLGFVPTAERSLSHLATRLPELGAHGLSWMITCLTAAGVPAAHPLLSGAAALLASQQQPDGRWQSEDGPGQDIDTTLEAIRALHQCLNS